MDPLTITTGALSLVTKSIIAVQTCQTYATKYKLADLSVAAIRTECASIRIALIQIQNLLPPDDGKNVRRQFEEYLLEGYESVLSACSLTFSLLNERLDSLGLNGLNERNESDLGSKLRLLWNETTMETIRQNIRGQAIAITLLLTAFQSETTAKTYQIIRNQEVRRSLKSVSDDARSLRDSISIAIARQSDLSTTGSVIGDEEFGFDDLVINSTAYRRVFVKEQKKLELQIVQEANEDDARNFPSEPQTSHLVNLHVGFGEESVVEQTQNKPRLRDRALGIFVRNRPRTLPQTLTANQVSQQLESLPDAHSMGLPQSWELSNQISASSTTPEPSSQNPPVDLAAEDLVAKAIEYHEAGALAESTYHFRLAAIQNHPTGMLIYALACRHGWGMRPNQQESVAWLRKASDYASLEMSGDNDLTVDNLEQKTRRAQFALSIYEIGVSLMNGWGILQDKELALRCFEIAGSWGDADALAEAGFCYAQGIGCKKDLKKSAKFYRQAEGKGISMTGNSWIHKAKYNDELDDSKKTSVLKQR